eukprot:GILK01013299.1.p1 GENE.GILK01013299.1~~GILK01013299.1.p1  ORF type:complete len:183 (-),score=6.40 GILK01013299.1:654-1202(-)
MPLAIDALITDIVSSSGSEHNLSDSQPSNRISIDYNKYRTKMCHYHIIKKPCPFGERCAIAHGDEQINTPILSSPTHIGEQSGYSSFSSRSNLVASSRLNAPVGPIQHVIQGSASVTRVNSYGNESPLSFSNSDTSFPPPPAYSDSKLLSLSSSSCAPPEYPYQSGRFRYDPYSPSGYAIVA